MNVMDVVIQKRIDWLKESESVGESSVTKHGEIFNASVVSRVI